MKRNIFLLSLFIVASCSSNQLAETQNVVENDRNVVVEDVKHSYPSMVVENMDSIARFKVSGISKNNINNEKYTLKINLDIECLSDESFPYDTLNFSLDLPNGDILLESQYYSSDDERAHMPIQKKITNVEILSGSIYFEVPSNFDITNLVLSYESLTKEKESRENKISLSL